ncbi:MAG: hydroxyisourate hydrolase [Bdellovibrio sp.]
MISTHILDTSSGSPAAHVEVKLEMHDGNQWSSIDQQKTNSDGRIAFNCPAKVGVYRLIFEVDQYFKNQKVEHFFLRTPVVFEVKDTNRKYHVPLLVNPYGYSTYRGS